MARIRTIKPEFPQSQSMGNVSRESRLLFILLWTLADDCGRLRGDSRMLASLLYPYDDDAKKLVPKWLSELEREKCIALYVVEGSTYLEVINWSDHQKIDKPSGSKIPAFDESARVLANPRELSSGDLDQGSRIKEGIKEGTKDLAIPDFVNAEAFYAWIEYRRAEGKPIKPHSYPALFRKLQKFGDHAAQMEAVDHSIGNTYQGLFADRTTNGSGAHKTPRAITKSAAELEAEGR